MPVVHKIVQSNDGTLHYFNSENKIIWDLTDTTETQRSVCFSRIRLFFYKLTTSAIQWMTAYFHAGTIY